MKVKKSECSDDEEQRKKLAKKLTDKINTRENFWRSFDRIIVYYDNGQAQLTKAITSVFNTLFVNVERRKVKPVDYKLFQVADLICTMEMLAEKSEHNQFTKSEIEFFGGERSFKKDYYKKLKIKEL